ncbi:MULTISPECIES: photosystem reaction center subunit H [Nostoc]|uniref:Photosystem reaction center subunit H n=1 Tax=Nostoc paludosum FACHB-159 TaxID=2692908 RepID=A0ABR8K599_9NOSO|nr:MULTISPECIES: photosystem reaction center subunit H [Nostoc]MBD2678595.1 photosystem reaction center subunit H [Nostoc sp. FACHB-857]MBD2734642.1 photosystem reaction center subunit H [Nostoc paludosum FACHB-159]
MLNVVRRSQIIGWIAIDSSTANSFGELEEVWLDDSGRIAYFSGGETYLPVKRIAGVGMGAVSVYYPPVEDTPENLRRLHEITVESTLGEPLGWVEDFLFDWQTGEIAAYIVAGEIAAPFGGRAVLYPEDVEEIAINKVIISEDVKHQLEAESEGLKGFFSEKSQQVQHLVHIIGVGVARRRHRLDHLISPSDKPEVVRVKIKEVSDEVAGSTNHPHHALQEATEFLQEQWHSLQQSITRAGERAKASLDAAWKQIHQIKS